MSYDQVVQIVQSIIQSVQNAAVVVGREVRSLANKTLSVRVENPQKKVEVTGKVAVDQSKTEAALKNTALAIRELKNALKPLKEVKVSNMVKMPPTPKFPEFPKKIEVSNLPSEMKISNMKEFIQAVGKIANSISEIDFKPEIKVGAPAVNVAAPIVNVPKQAAPVVNVAAPDMSELSKIKEFLESIGVKKPLAVRLSDGAKFYKALEKMAEIYAGSTFSAFQDSNGADGRAIINRNSEVQVTTSDTWTANNIFKDGDIMHIGSETVDGRWRFSEITTVGEDKTILYASVRNNPTIETYDEALDDYLNLEYGRVSAAL